MTEIQLLRATYRAARPRFAEPDSSLTERLDLLASVIAEAVDSALRTLPPDSIDLHVVSTTIIDFFMSCRLGMAEELLARIRAKTRYAPQAIVNAYECAGWGGVLRFASAARPQARSVVCTIVDLNVADLDFWLCSPHWGKSGFGVSVLHFLMPAEPGAQLVFGAAKGGNMLPEFASAVRAELLRCKHRPLVALPFFPAHVSEIFDRIIPDMQRLPDLHSRLGHCFGSDPWILIMENAAAVRDSGLPVLVSSVALSGYWAIAQISLHSEAAFDLELM